MHRNIGVTMQKAGPSTVLYLEKKSQMNKQMYYFYNQEFHYLIFPICFQGCVRLHQGYVNKDVPLTQQYQITFASIISKVLQSSFYKKQGKRSTQYQEWQSWHTDEAGILYLSPFTEHLLHPCLSISIHLLIQCFMSLIQNNMLPQQPFLGRLYTCIFTTCTGVCMLNISMTHG